MNKYKNIKTVVNSIRFDSKKEANRYQELCLLQGAGEIKHLELQPKFCICDSVIWNNRKLSKKYYIADFAYTDKDSQLIVEDVKGKRTRVYILKRQLFLNVYGKKYKFVEI